jgi:transketolase
MSDAQPTIVQRAVNAIRALTIDATQAAGDGHPGMPMGAAAMGYVLFRRVMRHDPSESGWWNRDRYVQSAGHGSMLQYSLLHLTGYDLTIDDLRGYRQWGSRTPGHPEVGHTPGVETTTGPLGQGIATAVGMALAEAHLAARYNRDDLRVIDHFTYVIASDGDLMEGVSAEASSLAGHLGLGKLIVLYDDNGISIDGPTDITFSEDVQARYRAYGWHVQAVADGNDVDAIEAALRAAQAAHDRPSLIAVRTTIGFGSPKLAGTSKVHGSPLGAAEAAATKAALGIDPEPFVVDQEVLDHYRAAAADGLEAHAAWRGVWAAYEAAHPEAAAELARAMHGDLPDDLPAALPSFPPNGAIATRKASQATLHALAPHLPELVGGSADLAGSNFTDLPNERAITRSDHGGRIIHFGIREHAMAAIANGLALHGGVRPFVATFLVFADYLRPALRLSALMRQRVVYVLTHDSIGLGGDGPTHQPIETLASLRAMPNLTLFRPADANETAQAWWAALTNHDGPSVLALTRQNVPTLAVPDGAVERGGYVAAGDGEEADALLIATGSEVALALAARTLLAEAGIRARVISLPSVERFAAQDAAYRERVIPASIRARVVVEAGATFGWAAFAGDAGEVIGIDRFGASAPGDTLMRAFGFTPEAIAAAAQRSVARVRGG